MNEEIKIDLKTDGDLAIFTLNESRFDSTIAGYVKGEFTILLTDSEIKKLVIDLSNLEYCDSSGLSAILLAYRLLQGIDGELRLANPQKGVKNLIDISQLNRILKVCDSVDQAVEELKEN
ncbi:MAG: anti-sigma factor antagonist [Ignavibacteria bacterium]|nr:MAG: anti-sigma factor antagonist [Ignavibacteria bacterium]